MVDYYARWDVAFSALSEQVAASVGTESVGIVDTVSDHLTGLASRVLAHITSVFTGYTQSELSLFEKDNRLVLRRILADHAIPKMDMIYPAPAGMVRTYHTTVTGLLDLYRKDNPAQTVTLLKDLQKAIADLDRIALAELLAQQKKMTGSTTIHDGLMDLFVSQNLGYRVTSSLFASHAEFVSVYTLLKTSDSVYTDAHKLSGELDTLKVSLLQTVRTLSKGAGIPKDVAKLGVAILKECGLRMTIASELLTKMTDVEHNFVLCLKKAKHEI